MKSKYFAIGLATALAVPLGVASQGLADGGKGKSSKDSAIVTKLYAKFALPVVTLPDEFRSHVRYQKKSSTTKGTEEEIEAKVHLAVPTSTDLNAVETTGYLVRILTGGVEKGSCVLQAKSIEFEYQSNVLSEFDLGYAAKEQEKTPLAGPPSTIKGKVGDCWVTTAVAPAVPGRGVPDVALGDTAEVSALTVLPTLPLIGPPTPGTLLMSGVFQAGEDHGDDDDDD